MRLLAPWVRILVHGIAQKKIDRRTTRNESAKKRARAHREKKKTDLHLEKNEKSYGDAAQRRFLIARTEIIPLYLYPFRYGVLDPHATQDVIKKGRSN